MNCNCIHECKDRLKELPQNNENYKGTEIVNVSIGSCVLMMHGSKMELETYSEVELQIKYTNKKGEEKTKKKKASLSHSYCPWCGKPYSKEGEK